MIKKAAIDCLNAEAEAILSLIPRIDDSFEEAVQLLLNCKGKVIVTGVGKSGHIATKMAATLASTGTPSFFLNPLDAFHGDLGMLAEDDVLVAISYSGNTDELIRFMPLLKERNIPIVGLSSNPESMLAGYSDVHLNIYVEREADPLNLAPTSSTTATLALCDALACALIQARNFQPADFARFHPGGDLGRRLMTTVAEMMVRDNLPLLSPSDTMARALEVVTNGKLGLGIVVAPSSEASPSFDASPSPFPSPSLGSQSSASRSASGQLVGIITDGDVRRAMQSRKEAFFTTPVSEVMSSRPKTIRDNARIFDAGEEMNHYSIHSLIVLDADANVVGVIDSFSCLPGTRFYH